MKNIESLDPVITETTADDIKDFWERNVNAEELFGKMVTTHERGTDEYFSALEEQRYRTHTHIQPWIKEMERGRNVLEIGSGIGMDSFQMAKHGLNVTGIDLTDIAIKIVSDRFKNNNINGSFETGDATNLRFENDTFDYIYSFGVLHHAQDTKAAINEAYRVLKPGGEARIMLYGRHSLNELIHRITKVPFEDKDELCPVVRRFSVNEIYDLFSEFDNIIIKKEYAFGEGYGIVFSLTPKWIYKFLSKHFGWHLMITANKN